MPESRSDSSVVVVLRPGPHPLANVSLPLALELHSGAEVITVDVVDRLRRRRGRMARLAVAAIARYGLGILRGRYNSKVAALRTPTAARLMRLTALEAVRELGLRDGFVTLQMQSLFDGHVEGVPHFVYTDHTHLANLQYASFDRRSLYSRAWIAEERLIYDNATAVFVRSSHVARSLEKDYATDPERICTVYAGANTDVAPNRLAHPERSSGIVFVGVDWERKGGPALAEAFTRVRGRLPEVTLTVVGCEPPKLPGMRVVGRVPLEEVSKHLAAAAVFCMPTKVEPFGISFVEAMAHGLPVVSTRVGALPDLIDEGVNGYLVAPDDVAGLTKALERFLADPEARRRAGKRSRELMLDRYTWESVVERMRPHLESDANDVGVTS